MPNDLSPTILSALLSESRDLVVLIDPETRIHQCSDSWRLLCGETQRFTEVLDEASVPKVLSALHRAEPWQRPVHVDLRSNIQEFHRVAFSRVRVGGMFLLIGRELGEQQALLERIVDRHRSSLRTNAELRRLANTDPLTGVSNRREVWRNARWIWDHASMATIALVDIDKFKRINDHYGHEAGDQVLQAVAEALTKAVGHGAVVGRWGGEEFVAVFEGDASDRGEKVLQEIRGVHLEGAPPSFRVTVSLGMAVAPDTTITIADAVAAADSAMYTAKEAGGDRMVLRVLQPRLPSIPPGDGERRTPRIWGK